MKWMLVESNINNSLKEVLVYEDKQTPNENRNNRI